MHTTHTRGLFLSFNISQIELIGSEINVHSQFTWIIHAVKLSFLSGSIQSPFIFLFYPLAELNERVNEDHNCNFQNLLADCNDVENDEGRMVGRG